MEEIKLGIIGLLSFDQNFHLCPLFGHKLGGLLNDGIALLCVRLLTKLFFIRFSNKICSILGEIFCMCYNGVIQHPCAIYEIMLWWHFHIYNKCINSKHSNIFTGDISSGRFNSGGTTNGFSSSATAEIDIM